MSERLTRARFRQILADAPERDQIPVEGPWVARHVIDRPDDLAAVVTGGSEHGAAWRTNLVSTVRQAVVEATRDGRSQTGWGQLLLRSVYGWPCPLIEAARLSAATWPALRDEQQARLEAGAPAFEIGVAVGDDSGVPILLFVPDTYALQLVTWTRHIDSHVFITATAVVEQVAARWARIVLAKPAADPVDELTPTALDVFADAAAHERRLGVAEPD